MTSTNGSMARLVLKDNITSGGALAPGQTLRLGRFTMIARSAVEPTMTSRAIENPLRINSEHSKQMDLAEFSSLNKLLVRIAALGIATDYDRIGPKTDQGEIETPPVTHQIAVVVEQDGESSSIPKTDYVRIADQEEPDTHPRKDATIPPNIASDGGPKQSEDIPEPRLLSPEGCQTPDNRSGRGSDLIPPTHPDIDALMSIKQ